MWQNIYNIAHLKSEENTWQYDPYMLEVKATKKWNCVYMLRHHNNWQTNMDRFATMIIRKYLSKKQIKEQTIIWDTQNILRIIYKAFYIWLNT